MHNNPNAYLNKEISTFCFIIINNKNNVKMNASFQ